MKTRLLRKLRKQSHNRYFVFRDKKLYNVGRWTPDEKDFDKMLIAEISFKDACSMCDQWRRQEFEYYVKELRKRHPIHRKPIKLY